MALVSAACGGGGQGGAASPAAGDPPPAAGAVPPSVVLTLGATRSAVGQPVEVRWEAAGATDCSADGVWSGARPAQGTLTLTPQAGGRHRLRLTCSGRGGTSAAEATLIVPMPVLPTSYANKNDIPLDRPQLPTIHAIAGAVLEAGEQDIPMRPIAFADFAQEGDWSALFVTSISKGRFASAPPGAPDSPTKLYFARRDAQGRWFDATADLLAPASSRYLCVSASFIEVADLNHDGRPDAAIACAGPDFMVDGLYPEILSEQYLVLSQPDGRYRVTTLGERFASHQMALADIDGDGHVDLLTNDTVRWFTPVVFWGRGDGTFAVDATRFPAGLRYKAIFGIRAVPVDGGIRVVVSGAPDDALPGPPSGAEYGTTVFEWRDGAFAQVADYGPTIPAVSGTGLRYGLALDVVYRAGAWYFLRVRGDNGGSAIIRTDAATGASTILHETVRGTSSDTSGVIKPTSDDRFVSQMAPCDPAGDTPGGYYAEQCALSVPRR